MYHAAVKKNVRGAYAALSRGDYGRVVGSFAPDGVLSMAGDHPLGGKFQGRDSIREWFERLFGYLPDFKLHPETIVVEGFPWETRVATCFRVTATLPGDRPYRNEGMQFLRLRWGRIVEDVLYEDTQVLAAALAEIPQR